MPFLVIAYPTISQKDFMFIQDYRQKHDELFYEKIEPHFTIVFPLNDKSQSELADDIRKQLFGARKIDFEIKRSISHKDEFSEYYYQFLIPDKGYKEIVNLHDKLYSDKLLSNWRRDIQYIPHITIGNSKNEKKSIELTEKLNSNGIAISGQIQYVTIARYEKDVVTNLEKFELQ